MSYYIFRIFISLKIGLIENEERILTNMTFPNFYINNKGAISNNSFYNEI